MKILNIHGYGGSPQNAAYNAVSKYGDVISPPIDYDNRSADDILSQLQSISEINAVNMITGTSLGGFFASVLSVRSGLPAVLVNPCLMPFYHLPELGYKGDIRIFVALFGELSSIDKNKVSCIVGGNDEIISTHSFTKNLLDNDRFRIIPDGCHSGFTLPLDEYFADIFSKWCEM